MAIEFEPGHAQATDPFSLAGAAAMFQDRPAIVSPSGQLSYCALRGAAERVKERWPLLEVRTATSPAADQPPPIAVVAGRDLESVVVVLALIDSQTPFALLPPRWTAGERARAVAAIGGCPILAEEEVARLGALDEQSAGGNGPGLERAAREQVLAVVFTSGSSGSPTAVALGRQAMARAASASAQNLGVHADDRWLLSLPVAHVGGLSILTRCLRDGMAVVLADGTRFRAREFVGTVERHGVTICSVVPTMLRRLLDASPALDSPPHLRAMLVGGAAASPALIDEAASRGWPVLSTYGMTEAASQIATESPELLRRSERRSARRGVGKPLAGTDVRIQADGEIEVRGDHLMLGRWRAGLFEPHRRDRWFATGDYGRLDEEGRLEVFGRRTDRIVTGGENVDPVEVEQAIERHEEIAAALVCGLSDPEWGEIVAAVVVAKNPPADTERLIGRVHEALCSEIAGYKCPRRWLAVKELPVGPTGKLDRQRARALFGDDGARG